MKTPLLLLSLLGSYTVALAQNPTIIRVKAEENLKNAIPLKDQFRYPEFRPGTVSFFNGTSVDTRLNYNLMTKEMQFINPRGDTLTLANEYTIKKMDIDKDLFLFNSKAGYLEVLGDYDQVRLATNQMLIQVRGEKMGAYNQSSGVSSINSIKSFADQNGKVQQLVNKADLLFAKKDAFYFIDKNGNVFPATRASLLKLFPSQKKELDSYIREHKISFIDRSDLEKVLQQTKAFPAPEKL
jgi:hypothetical protein